METVTFIIVIPAAMVEIDTIDAKYEYSHQVYGPNIQDYVHYVDYFNREITMLFLFSAPKTITSLHYSKRENYWKKIK